MEKDMARLSLEGTLKKSQSGASPRISQALHGLLNSLDEIRDVKTALSSGSAAEADHSCCSTQTDEATPSLLRRAVATMKGMVETLVSEMEAKPEVQKLLLLIQNSTDREQPSCQVSKVACTNSAMVDSRKRVAVGCRHTCDHHPEVIDSVLWSRLPQEVVELVLACLPMQQLVEICRCSQLWPILSKSPDFRQECSRRHPKLFGLVGWKEHPGRTVCTVVYDIEADNWSYGELALTEHDYDDAFFACDEGLVCFAPRLNLASSPVLVGNPLTDEWRALPRMPVEMVKNMESTLVQLVMEDDGKAYRVIVVCHINVKVPQGCNALCYDSRTDSWSVMESGLVYDGCSSLTWTATYAPYVFDCVTKFAHELIACPALEGVHGIRYAMVKDRLFVLHEWSSDTFPHLAKRFIVSEYEWQSSASDLSRVRTILSTLPRDLPREIYEVHLFACNGFLLLIADNGEGVEDQHQIIRFYDSSLNDWQSLSMGGNFRFTNDDLQCVHMCRLRWDAIP